MTENPCPKPRPNVAPVVHYLHSHHPSRPACVRACVQFPYYVLLANDASREEQRTHTPAH